MKTATAVADMYKAHCSLNNGMTDEVRQMFLDKHNGYRSLVAKGQASNGQGGFAPKAARLPKMNYGCDIETNVMNWVKQCKYESSPYSERAGGYGENLWMSPDNKMDKTNAAVESTAAWFSALQTQGKWLQATPGNTLNFLAYYFGAQNYTQMVWQKSLVVGCAVAPCDTMTLVGCQYKFMNTVGGLIYDVGEPCTTNEDCKCYGCLCSKEEALCLVPPQTQSSFWQWG
ncbi:SCP-like protein [Teladorsagia circumcincta]|uniref:SCP-like protein n=1 Tax=Teladorsagia circumcincta TaxID=45464 RepID=A0A2G9TRW1_TELCI|nr:SCP-like protein [Teladorsagia circumcincta]